MTTAARRAALTFVAASALALGPVVPAQAATVTCKPGAYFFGDYGVEGAVVTRLRATGLPKLTSDYAPRCLVADSAAGRIVSHTPRYSLPRTVRIYGARWNAGRWKVTSFYSERLLLRSVRFTQGKKRITFRLAFR